MKTLGIHCWFDADRGCWIATFESKGEPIRDMALTYTSLHDGEAVQKAVKRDWGRTHEVRTTFPRTRHPALGG